MYPPKPSFLCLKTGRGMCIGSPAFPGAPSSPDSPSSPGSPCPLWLSTSTSSQGKRYVHTDRGHTQSSIWGSDHFSPPSAAMRRQRSRLSRKGIPGLTSHPELTLGVGSSIRWTSQHRLLLFIMKVHKSSRRVGGVSMLIGGTPSHQYGVTTTFLRLSLR